MIKFVKKAVSTLLASIMCVPTGILTIANATESNPNGSYTVTLTDTENGLIQFSEESMANSTASQDSYQMMQVNEDGEMEQIENDGSLWAFSEGDNVEVELIPDDGFYVESLILKDSESGKELAKKDTVDNVFSFIMPSKNVSVEAVFTSTATINIKDDKDTKKSDGIEYHDIVEDMDITKDEVEEIVADVITENYIKSNINEKYIKVGDGTRLANILLVNNTIFDGQYVEENDTIDSIMYSIENGDKDIDENMKKFISQLHSYVMVYDMDVDSKYYVAYANTMIRDMDYTVQDVAVAINNTNGELVDGCIYDEETGLLYIPKKLYEAEGGKAKFLDLQIQFMQVFNKASRDSDESMGSEVHMVSVDEEMEQIKLSSSEQKIFSMQTELTVDKDMDADNLNVLMNGLPVSEDSYQYNPETGNLTLAVSPASINSIEVTEGESTLSDELLDFIEETEALTSGSQLNSFMQLPDPIDIASVPFLKESLDTKQAIIGTAYTEYLSNGSRDENLAGQSLNIIYSGINPQSLVNYISNGSGGGFDVEFIPETFPDGTTSHPFFVHLGTFCAIDGSGNAYADEEHAKLNQFINQFGNLGKLQLKCAHFSSPLGDTGKGENADYSKVAIRLLEEVHEEREGSTDGYLVFGVFTQSMQTQIGSGVFRVDYESSTTEEEGRDPFYLYMYKKATEKANIAGARLSGAEFTIDFYENQNFTSVANAERIGRRTATFKFSTESTTKNGIGSDYYRNIAKMDGIKADFGIDFTPKADESGKVIEDDEKLWFNDFLVSDRATYTKYFGKKGTYVIKETDAPEGYKLSGTMEGFGTDKSTSKLTEGMALYVKPGVNEDGEPTHEYRLNGKKITTPVISTGNDPGLALITHENPSNVDIVSNAICVDTNQQYAGSAYGTVTVRDTITVSTTEKKEAKYFITTKLKDKTANRFLSVQWKKKSSYSEDNKTGTEFKTEFSTGGDVTAGDHVTFDVEGLIDLSGLEGHTLVFINYMYVKGGSDGSGNAIYPTGYTSGLGKATSEDDVLEQIRIIDGISTSISSTQTNRKAATGESIAYAGMYKDNSYTEGNGAIMQSLKDTITFAGLEKGKEYRIKAWLMDVTDGTPAPAVINGKKMEIEEPRKATAKDGTWDITFQFDGTGCEGKKYVSYVEVYDNDRLILEHKKPADGNESFYIPKITTKLLCKNANNTDANVATNAETINFEDTITYKNLIPNARYKVETKVMDYSTGKELTDAKGNKASVNNDDKVFTANGVNGTHTVRFSLAGVNTDGNGIVTSSLAGKTIVVYQYLYIEKDSNGSNQWVLVAEHADINDKDQSLPITRSGPLYLYLYKRSAGGETYGNANLDNAIFEIQYYKGQKFNSAKEATKRGTLTATFTFKTGSAKDASLGSVAYRDLANAGDINAFHGIDFFPKVDAAGKYIYDENGEFQNDFLVDGKEEYSAYIGQPGTYVIREIEAPVGYSLSGEMSGYQSGQKTPKVTEGLALRIDDMVNSNGDIIHEYRINGERVKSPVVNAVNMPNEETGVAIITLDNPEFPTLTSEARCLDTMQQYASSDSTTVSLRDHISVRTVAKVDAKYTVITKLKDLTANKYIDVRWRNIGEFADNGQVGDRFTSDRFQSVFSTNQSGINAGDTVKFNVEGIVDGTALKGHTLVFINYLLVKEGADGLGDVIWGADSNGTVKNGGLGEASSEDDKNEMVYFPEPQTDIISAQNKRKGLFGEGIIYAGMYKDDTWTEGHGTRFQTLIDTIYYENCEPGREYTVKGWLMDAATGAPALDANNNEIKSMQTTWKQVADGTGNGSWEISFQFDATGCGGRKYVSYVEIYLGSELVASFKDINDAKESFLIPKITTKLRDNETGIDLSYADETISLTDTISYSKMMVGANYKIKTKVIDVDTGKELVDVNGNTVKVPDTEKKAETEDGTWDIPISFAASKKNSDGTIAKTLAGKTIVVYEYVYIEKEHNGSGQWVLIADHEDFGDR